MTTVIGSQAGRPRMPRVLVFNNYSIPWGWDDARNGDSPAHFLYGIDYLSAHGFEINQVSHRYSNTLWKIDEALKHSPIPIGSIDRQISSLHFLREADVIYSMCEPHIQALCYLRTLGFLDAPIVCLGHHPWARGRLALLRRPLHRAMLKGIAAYPTLSSRVADEVNSLVRQPLAHPIAWGPDAAFYPPAEYPGHGIVAAGRTGRDFALFGRAASRSKVPVTIVCPQEDVPPESPTWGNTVRVVAETTAIPYRKLVRTFASARALAIPMYEQNSLCGLTSLLDALGAGKPVLMTRNRFIDIDIEALGIGRWIDADDEAGWHEALRYFVDHPREAEAMGRRARKLAESQLSYDSFCRSLHQIILGAMDHAISNTQPQPRS